MKKSKTVGAWVANFFHGPNFALQHLISFFSIASGFKLRLETRRSTELMPKLVIGQYAERPVDLDTRWSLNLSDLKVIDIVHKTTPVPNGLIIFFSGSESGILTQTE
jgi:hypothetical protein